MTISTATQYPDDVPSSPALPSPAPLYIPPLHLADLAPTSCAGSPISLPQKAGRVTQVSMSGYVTPGSLQSNSSSLLYPGPVYGTSFVPSPLVPSPPCSQTSDDVPAKPAGQNKAWQVGISSSTSGSSTCTYISLFVLPFGTWLTDFRIARTDRPEPSPSHSQAHTPHFHMHPLLSYT
jgi:hypothetical protein